jgi:hypothetical protein
VKSRKWKVLTVITLDHCQILQNLHPLKGAILHVLLQHKEGITKKEIVQYTGMCKEEITVHLHEMKKKKIVDFQRPNEPWDFLLDAIVTFVREQNTGNPHKIYFHELDDLKKDEYPFKGYSSVIHLYKLKKLGYIKIHKEKTDTWMNIPQYNRYYRITPDGFSYYHAQAPVTDWTPHWFPTKETIANIEKEGIVPCSNFYNILKRKIENLSFAMEEALEIVLKYKDEGLTKEKIEKDVSIPSKAQTILCYLGKLRQKGIVYAVKSCKANQYMLNYVVNAYERQHWIDKKELGALGLAESTIQIGLYTLFCEGLIEVMDYVIRNGHKRYFSVESYEKDKHIYDEWGWSAGRTCVIRPTQKGIDYIHGISPVVYTKKGQNIWYPTPETLHVLGIGEHNTGGNKREPEKVPELIERIRSTVVKKGGTVALAG